MVTLGVTAPVGDLLGESGIVGVALLEGDLVSVTLGVFEGDGVKLGVTLFEGELVRLNVPLRVSVPLPLIDDD